MRRWMVIAYLALVPASIQAQINPQALTLAGVNDCIKEAIGTSSVEDSGSVIIYSCSAVKAKALYNFVGRKAHNGKPADDFRCDLILGIGDVLSE